MKELNNKLLASVRKEEVDKPHQEYFEITIAFFKLFISNLEHVGARTNQLKKAKFGQWVTPIRLMMEQDEVTKQELIDVFKFLDKHPFWTKNILSTEKLRKQFDQLDAQLKLELNGEQTDNNQPKLTPERVRTVAERLQSKFGNA